jgi:hypothetical protein
MNYSPTVNLGDTRRRTRYIGISTNLDSLPTVEVLEQDIVKLSGGEVVLRNLGNLKVSAYNPDEEFDIRNPETDELTGSTATVGQAMALIYSWVRKNQLLRDQASEQ